MQIKKFSIEYIERKPFDIAIQMAFSDQYESNPIKSPILINGYKIVDNVLYLSRYSDKPDIIKFPYPFNIKQTADFVYGWLESVKPLEHEPDTDGSIKQGWIICNYEHPDGKTYFYDLPINKQFNGDWGLLFCAKPVWLVYGK